MWSIEMILASIPGAFIALFLRERIRALCTTKLGDPTARQKKLTSGNPFKHIEPIGFIIAVIFGFGWGAPTPTSPLYYKDRKKGVLICSIMPILVNLVVGLVMAIVLRLILPIVLTVLTAHEVSATMYTVALYSYLVLFRIAWINVATAIFNLIPVHPLDGAKILQLYLSPNASVKMTQNEKIMQMVLILLMVFGILGAVIDPIVWLFFAGTLPSGILF